MVLVSRSSDEERLENVYRETGDRLWRALLAFSGDREVADEAVAEAFAQALQRDGVLVDPAAWVWASAFRIARGILAQRTAIPLVDVDVASAAINPEALMDLLEQLRRLSPSQRAAVILHHYVGYSVAEIAAILGSSKGAVRVHLSVGRNRLRQQMEDRDER
jgi:RNA polymerase sigma-70 factor (ECF subfamily)